MNRERMSAPYLVYRIAQQIDMPRQQVVAVPLQQIYRKEISAARMPGATIVGHAESLVKIVMRRNARWLLRPTGCPISTPRLILKLIQRIFPRLLPNH